MLLAVVLVPLQPKLRVMPQGEVSVNYGERIETPVTSTHLKKITPDVISCLSVKVTTHNYYNFKVDFYVSVLNTKCI